jgi:putative autoinducer-2 (AI-2) aldolase
MDWGMSNRLARVMGPGGRAVMLAVDHGYFMGPTSGLEDPRRTIAPLLPFADSIMLTRGVLRTSVDPAAATRGVVLRVSGGSSILKELSNEDVTVTMEDALRLDASAVALSIFVGAEFEKQTLVSLARLVDEGQRYGMPVLAVTAVGKDMARDARYLGLACRIAAELGAHLVKTYYCEDFESVVGACPIPIIVAGGKKTPEREGGRGHGPQHLPVERARGDDPGRARRRARPGVGRGRLRDLRGHPRKAAAPRGALISPFRGRSAGWGR